MGALEAGMGIAGGIANTIIGDGLRKSQERRQMKNAKEMAIFNREQQMKMWEDTNYSAQREQMEKAGLNVGLMYGGQGEGGTANANTGSAGMSNANADITTGMGLGLQAGLQKAQIQNIEAQTEKTKTETENLGGIVRDEAQARIADLTQNVKSSEAKEAYTKAQTALTELQNIITEKTIDSSMDRIEWEAQRAGVELQRAQHAEYVDRETRDKQIEMYYQTVLGAMLQNTATRANTKLTEAQISKVGADVAQMMHRQHYENREIAVKELEAVIKQEMPSLWNVGGGIVNDVLKTYYDAIEKIGQRKPNRYK